MADLPRQTSHTLQMRTYDFTLQVDAKLTQKYLLDGRGNFGSDCYFTLPVELRVGVIHRLLRACKMQQYITLILSKSLLYQSL